MKTKTVAKWKTKEVKEIKELAEKYNTVAVVDLQNLPNKQLQIARKKLRGKIVFKLTKKSLITRAFKESGKDHLVKLSEDFSGTPAIIFTDMGAFELFRLLKQNRQYTAAKPGQLAPSDLWVQAGPTSFVPGPIISDLGKLGIKNKVEGGKIVFINDTLIVAEGKPIDETAASILSKLGIEPIEIKVKMVVASEGSEIYKANVMNIDTDVLTERLRTAASDVFKLTIGIGLVTKDNASYLIAKAFRDTKAVAEKSGLLIKETAGEVLSKVESEVDALKSQIKEE